MSTDLTQVSRSPDVTTTSNSTITVSDVPSPGDVTASGARRQQVLRAQTAALPDSRTASGAIEPGEMWGHLKNIKDTTARWGIWLDGLHNYVSTHGHIGVEPLVLYASAIHALSQDPDQAHQTHAANEIVRLMAGLKDGARFGDLDVKISRVLRAVEMAETSRLIAECLLTDIESDKVTASFAGKQHFVIWALKTVDADGRLFDNDRVRRADITRLELVYQPSEMRAQTWAHALDHHAERGVPMKEVVRPFARSIELIPQGDERDSAVSRLVRTVLEEASRADDPAPSVSATIHETLMGASDETVRLGLAKRFFDKAEGTMKKTVRDALMGGYDAFSPTQAFALKDYLPGYLP
ncbi:hypothetical protein [Pandoraea anapnoica]|nr:hypothetical protein [Pandoraea anapnoica]